MMHVLLVDDDDAVRDCVADLLAEEGMRVTEASSGEESLAISGLMDRPDVLVTDLRLGAGMDGCRLAATARRRWPGLPVVLMSGDAPLDYALSGGHVAFLPKPFQSSGLVKAINSVSRAAVQPT